MEFDQQKLEEFKANQKTQFLCTQFDDTAKKLEDAKTMAEDPGMAELAADEIKTLEESLQAQFEEMDRIVENSREEEKKPYGVTLEVRAGAGGDEAALFAEELANMYLAYAQRKGWQTSRKFWYSFARSLGCVTV
mgnify:CR=1 FL=1